MKRTFNITTDNEDLRRYASSAELSSMLKNFDGVELMYLGEDKSNIILHKFVIGLHMNYFPFWVDFFKGNIERVEAEFDTLSTAYSYYGGKEPYALINFYKKELETAKKYGAEYVVFHVSESNTDENFSGKYYHSDEYVCDAAAELLNEVFKDEKSNIDLLLENLWQSGFTFTNPKTTSLLLEKINYKNTGIMLDTGHLIHTNTSLKTQEEALIYINKMLDAHGSLTKHIKGMHLHQSLTGEYMESTKLSPPKNLSTYAQKQEAMFMHAFNSDKHQPFTAKGVKELISRISPEYLTLEFMSSSKEEHIALLNEQLNFI